MSKPEQSSPQLTISELAQLLSPAVQARLEEGKIFIYDGPLIWVTHPGGVIEQLPEQEQPPTTNGTYSESSTRLQTSLLHAISVLEDRNKSLQQALDEARASGSERALAELNTAQRIGNLQERNKTLQLELNATRSTPNAGRAEIQSLNTALAAKNTKIKEKNSKIIHVEQEVRRLQADLAAEKKKNRSVGGAEKKRKHTDFVRGAGDSRNPWVVE